jgi:hypothetical protein
MARRKQLKGIAGNLARWIVSRNFDVEGYWAVGLICLYAESRELAIAAEILKHQLSTSMNSCKLPACWLVEVEVNFQFNTCPNPKYHSRGFVSGKPFMCTVSLTTDLGRTFKNRSGAFCRPYDPKRELRRHRFKQATTAGVYPSDN